MQVIDGGFAEATFPSCQEVVLLQLLEPALDLLLVNTQSPGNRSLKRIGHTLTPGGRRIPQIPQAELGSF